MSTFIRPADAARQAEQRDALAQALRDYPTQRPHLLHLILDGGVSIRIQCPGREHCKLWYVAEGDRGRCGVEVEAGEVGSEFLEWQVGPEVEPPTNPIPIGFTWTGGGEDDPPEIEWWPLPEDALLRIRVHTALDNAERNGYDMRGWGWPMIGVDLKRFDADLEDVPVERLVPHIESWFNAVHLDHPGEA